MVLQGFRSFRVKLGSFKLYQIVVLILTQYFNIFLFVKIILKLYQAKVCFFCLKKEVIFSSRRVRERLKKIKVFSTCLRFSDVWWELPMKLPSDFTLSGERRLNAV